MQEIQELGRRSSKIGEKKFFDSDKKLWKRYSRCFKRCEYKTPKVRWKKFRKYILKDDSRSFYSGIQEIQELGRINSKIRKKKFLGSDKKF